MDRNKVIDKAFREHGNKILYAVAAAGCPSQDLKDILHQTMVIALENFDKLKDSNNVVAWCTKIAINLVYRKQKRESKVVLVDFNDEESIQFANIDFYYNYSENGTYDAESIIEINRILGMLSPEYAEPLYLKTIIGYTYEEIAEIMQINIGTVRSRINRAKKTLARILIKESAKDQQFDGQYISSNQREEIWSVGGGHGGE